MVPLPRGVVKIPMTFSVVSNRPLSYIPSSSSQTVAENNTAYSSGDVPYKGTPGSHVISPDGTKERIYGENGLPAKDRHHTNHGNPKEHPDVPHDHDWGYNEQGKWEPGPGYKSPDGPLTLSDDIAQPEFSFNFSISSLLKLRTPVQPQKSLFSMLGPGNF